MSFLQRLVDRAAGRLDSAQGRTEPMFPPPAPRVAIADAGPGWTEPAPPTPDRSPFLDRPSSTPAPPATRPRDDGAPPVSTPPPRVADDETSSIVAAPAPPEPPSPGTAADAQAPAQAPGSSPSPDRPDSASPRPRLRETAHPVPSARATSPELLHGPGAPPDDAGTAQPAAPGEPEGLMVRTEHMVLARPAEPQPAVPIPVPVVPEPPPTPPRPAVSRGEQEEWVVVDVHIDTIEIVGDTGDVGTPVRARPTPTGFERYEAVRSYEWGD